MTNNLSHDKYKVAWICPLEVEQIAAMEMLDEEHKDLPQSAADHNVYSLGSINGHNVVIAGLHQPGNCPAAMVVAQMRMTFPHLRFGLLVGIGGGVPVQTDSGIIRLGHVVVSKPAGEHSGAVQYDHGKASDGQFQRTGALAPPPAVLLNAAQALAVRRARIADDPVHHLLSSTACDQSYNLSQRIHRTKDNDDTFVVVHRGTIASGELVVKTAALRDTLAQQYGLLCFEMEAAGALSDFPCMVIRGIFDYCDSHKNDQWHGYAAAVAAAYARQLFFHMPIDEVQRITTYTLAFKLPGVTAVNRFVARGNELKHMYKVLKWTGERRTAVLQGLGGMGKTQLSIEYARRHRSNYTATLWLNARDETSLTQSFQQAARRIAQEYPTVAYVQNAIANRDLDETTEAVKRWLDETGNDRWLIIYDNYDDVRFDGRGGAGQSVKSVREQSGTVASNTSETEAADSKAYDIRPYFPETDHGAIIITTRSSRVKLGQLIRLAILESTSNRTHLSQDPDAYALAGRLDGLPLALSTAGAYLNQVSTTFAEYLQLYDESWLRLHRESPQLLDYNQALYSTWGVSFNHIQQQSRGAAMLLRFWAYFDNEDLWYELLQEAGSSGPVWLQDITKHKLNFNATMRVLCEHRLVEADRPTKESGVDSQGYNVHGYVDEEMAWTAMRCVALHVPNLEQQEYWIVQRRLVQHADRCITRTATDATGEHTLTLNTVGNLGLLYSNQGRLKEAEAMYERALEGKEKVLGPEHTSTLSTVNNLGSLYSDQGRLKEAKAMYERALQGYEKALGPETIRTYIPTLNTLQSLGSLYEKLGETGKAISYYQRAQNGFLSVLGPQNERYRMDVSLSVEKSGRGLKGKWKRLTGHLKGT
ncbi:purine and uridine phosphorylase [Colletotrichum falcatum]|nr:purine and uridine phosphorylase [Colletotrichum falcatum]